MAGGTYELTTGYWKVKEHNPTAIALRSHAARTSVAAPMAPFVGLLVLLVLGLGLVWRSQKTAG